LFLTRTGIHPMSTRSVLSRCSLADPCAVCKPRTACIESDNADQ
jgi:hypothetical protein